MIGRTFRHLLSVCPGAPDLRRRADGSRGALGHVQVTLHLPRWQRSAAMYNTPRKSRSMTLDISSRVSICEPLTAIVVSRVTSLPVYPYQNGSVDAMGPSAARGVLVTTSIHNSLQRRLAVKWIPAVLALILVILFTPSTSLAANGPEAGSPSLIFLESVDARGALQQERIGTRLAQLVREMQLAGREMPNILVFHVSEKAGRAAGIRRSDIGNTSVRINSNHTSSVVYYEVWLVGDGSPAEYTIALENILEHHFELKLTDAERKQVGARVIRYLLNTVSAYGE